MLVHQFLERSAQSRPDAIALLHGDERASYGEIESGANRIAHRIVDAGVRAGDRVGLIADNSRLYVESFFGILKAGGVAVPLNTAADAAGLRATLHDCGARALVSGSRFAALAAEAGATLPELDAVFVPRVEDAAAFPPGRRAVVLGDSECAFMAGPPEMPRSDRDRAAIIYTSGSTGRPKGATLRHANIVANAESIVSYLALGPSDRVLVVLPFFYVYGQSLLTTHVAAGGSLVLENRFLFPSAVVDTLAR